MPDISATLSFLRALPLYHHEKPYNVFLSPEDDVPPESNLTNVEDDLRADVVLQDIRESDQDFSLQKHGFQVLCHKSMYSGLDDPAIIEGYKKETEDLLKRELNAEHVICWGYKRRTSVRLGMIYDYNDLSHWEALAKMVHCDHTFDSGLAIINSNMSCQDQLKYLNDDYEIRLVNTWRSLKTGPQDCPLTLCDFQSVGPEDLASCDRIVSDKAGEIYLFKHNKKQRWYWLDGQTPEEPFLILTWSSESANSQARYCPHVSFANERAGPDIHPRQSCETRSIVISRK